jgi:TM2 domain
MRFILLFILGIFVIGQCELHAQSTVQRLAFNTMFEETSEGVWELRERWNDPEPADTVAYKDNARLIAICLNVSLGMLGVHRMYLGTDVKVPIFYTLTFGGGGVLWLVDLGFLIASKDIRPFMHNKHLFMFSRR